MTCMLKKWKLGLLSAGICIMVILATVLTVAGQGTYSSGSYETVPSTLGSSASTSSTASSDRAYCVGLGYLYRTAPGINNGQGFCQFGGYSWCDAHSFATGSCGPSTYGFNNPYGYYYPYYYSAYPYGQSYGGSISSCQDYGGSIERIHTPYGDVDECVFPNGNAMNLYGLYNGYPGDNWYYYAYNYLNAP